VSGVGLCCEHEAASALSCRHSAESAAGLEGAGAGAEPEEAYVPAAMAQNKVILGLSQSTVSQFVNCMFGHPTAVPCIMLNLAKYGQVSTETGTGQQKHALANT